MREFEPETNFTASPVFPGSEAPRARRILVLGSSGSGKTTFARQLGEALGLKVVHLDSHFWLPNWVPSSREDWENKLTGLLEKDEWVMDGNYPRSLARRLERATRVILLDIPRWTCLVRCTKRLRQNWGRTRDELAPGCREKIDWDFFKWIWSYPEVVRPDILTRLEKLPPEKSVTILKSPAEIDRYLNTVQDGVNNREITRMGKAYGT